MADEPQFGRWTYGGVIALALVFPSLVTWLYFVALADRAPALQQAAAVLGKLLQFALPVVWVFVVQRRSVKLAAPRASDLAIGLASGAAIVAAMLVLYEFWLAPSGGFNAASVAIRAKVRDLGIDSPWKYAALGLFYALVHSLLEEYYWRWFVFAELRRAMQFRPAAIVSSLGFMAHHVILLGVYFGFASPLAYLLALCVAIGGLIWAWLYERSGSLYGPWASHLVVDAGIFVIGWQIARSTWL